MAPTLEEELIPKTRTINYTISNRTISGRTRLKNKITLMLEHLMVSE